MDSGGKADVDDLSRVGKRHSLPEGSFPAEKHQSGGDHRRLSRIPSSQNTLPTLTEKLLEHNKRNSVSNVSVSAPGSSRRTPSRSRSRPSRSGGRYSLTPTKNRQTQIRELRERQRVRRRRSSMIVMEDGKPGFDPSYVGPITLDYLRFFCQISVDAKKKSAPATKGDLGETLPTDERMARTSLDGPSLQDRASSRNEAFAVEINQGSPRRSRINSSPLREFDDSLPLPAHVGDLDIHEATKGKERSVFPDMDIDSKPVNTENDPGPVEETKEQKAFSYLERILQARKKQNRVSDGDNDIRQAGSDILDKYTTEDSTPFLSDKESRLIIEDGTIHDTHSLQDYGTIVSSNSAEHNEDPVIGPAPQLDNFGTDEINNFQDQNINDYAQADNSFDPFDQPDVEMFSNEALTPQENEPESDTPSHLGSPPIITQDYVYNTGDTNDFFGDPISSSSISGILDNFSRTEKDDAKSIPLSINNRMSKNKGESRLRKSVSNSNQLPITLLKRITKSVRLKSAHDKTSLSYNMKRLKNYPPHIYDFLQRSSDRFLQSMVSDLEAYASHRSNDKTRQINIKDVMLYLRRIKFYGTELDREKEIESISKLAQQFLPLELLIELHDSLDIKKNAPIQKQDYDSYSEEE